MPQLMWLCPIPGSGLQGVPFCSCLDALPWGAAIIFCAALSFLSGVGRGAAELPLPEAGARLPQQPGERTVVLNFF